MIPESQLRAERDRTKQQVDELKEAHSKEIDSLNKSHEAQIRNLERTNADRMTAKDVQYQREIEALQELNRRKSQSS